MYELSEKIVSLEQQLNITREQLIYFKEATKDLTIALEKNNDTSSLIGEVSIPIVALRIIQSGYNIEYKGEVLLANLELVEGEGRILINT